MKHSKTGLFQANSRGTLLFIVIIGLLAAGSRQALSVHAAAKPLYNTATSACASGQHCVYLPAVNAAPPGDLVLSKVEVTQAVQDGQNGVPLVAGRATILRIYAHTDAWQQAAPSIKIALTARNANNVVLSGSPQAYTATLPAANSRDSYASTINIPLPASWASGTVDLTINLDPDNAIKETTKSNNTLTQHLVFTPVAPLRVMIVPIRYHNTSNGITYAAPSQDTVSDWIKRTYPISSLQISWHAPYDFSGDLSTSTDFSNLLSDITTVKSSEGGPADQAYYGLIPTASNGSQWFYGGIAGLGWIGARTAVGLELAGQTSQIAAHEIGHNLGMAHTPCGNPAGPDPSYPYKDGSIGQVGLDVSTGTLYPASTKDVMSYCDPKWISDYTYKTLYNSQVKISASAAMTIQSSGGQGQRGLLVRANITPKGVNLLPAYVLPGQVNQTPAAGEYQVQVLGQQGETLVDLPVKAYQVGDMEEANFSSINEVIALPDQPAAKVRLLKDGQVLGEQAIEEHLGIMAAGVTAEPAADGYHLRWTGTQKPALVRYSTDGGKTWTTLGVDVTGSEMTVSGLPGTGVIFDVVTAGEWK